MSCFQCRHTREWSRSLGVGWLRSWTRLCWHHRQQLNGWQHIAARACLAFGGVILAVMLLAGLTGWLSALAQDVCGLTGRR
jgi:hypothetical protein